MSYYCISRTHPEKTQVIVFIENKKNPATGGVAGLRPIGVKYAVHDPRYLDLTAQPMFILTFGGK